MDYNTSSLPAAEVAANTHHEHRDDIGSKMGMWLFLFTELLLFGGLFLAYAVYRYKYQPEFKLAALELSTMMGAVNTVVLLTSSLTMALSITAIQKGNKTFSVFNLSLTIVFAFVFLINKFFEWSIKFSHGLYPKSEEMLNKSNGEIVFYGLYYLMTGLHGLHIIIGIIILLAMLYGLLRNGINKGNFVALENSGLYWHLVDLIWIFLFPLFYLIH